MRRAGAALAVEQFVGAGLNEGGRQAAQFGVQRRRVGPARVGAVQVVSGAGRSPLEAEHRLAGRRRRRCVCQRQVDPGRKQQQRRRAGVAAVTQRQRGAQRQPAAGRVAADDHRAGGLQRAAGGHGVVHRGRERVLGCQPVVERKDRHATEPRQPPGDGAVRGRRAHAVGAAMKVEQGAMAGCAGLRSRPLAGHAADARRLEVHAARRQRQVRHPPQPAALKRDRKARREHRLEQALQRLAQNATEQIVEGARRFELVDRHGRECRWSTHCGAVDSGLCGTTSARGSRSGGRLTSRRKVMRHPTDQVQPEPGWGRPIKTETRVRWAAAKAPVT